METLHYEILVDGVPYIVNATPFEFNTETRFKVSFNGSDEYVFTWDSSLGRLTAIGDETGSIPDNLENEISARLESSIR